MTRPKRILNEQKELVNDKIISEAAFLQAKNAFENAQNGFQCYC